MRTRYPRTPHLPWSPGATSDDVRVADLDHLQGREVVVTEKLDGENTTIARDYTHARSLDSAHHPSRSPVKALQARIGRHLPQGWRICGENLYARHSVAYDALPAWFVAFNVWDDDDRCLPWDDTVVFCHRLGVPTAPVRWRGSFDARVLRRALTVDTSRSEGFVVRTTEGFGRADFARHVAKWVRAGHVTDTSGVHWMLREVVPNGLGPRAALWSLRAGGEPDAEALGALLDTDVPELHPLLAAIDGTAPIGDDRLAAVLAATHPATSDHALLTELLPLVGHRCARTALALRTFAPRLRQVVPDDTRRPGLTSLARAVPLGLLHAYASWGATPAEAETVAWSRLVADDAGLLDPATLPGLFDDVPLPDDPELASWCRDGVLRAFGDGRLRSAAEATAVVPHLEQRARSARVTLVVGPSGSGKSTYVARLDRAVISLDDLRARRGRRADQSHNDAVLAEATETLRDALRDGVPVVWDATSLTGRHRAHVLGLARRYHAPATVVSLLVDGETLRQRNHTRRHTVPDEVLEEQLAGLAWPWPHEADRVLDVVGDGQSHPAGVVP